MTLDEVGLAVRNDYWTFPTGEAQPPQPPDPPSVPPERPRPPGAAPTTGPPVGVGQPPASIRSDVPSADGGPPAALPSGAVGAAGHQRAADLGMYWYTQEEDPTPYDEHDGGRFRYAAGMTGVEVPVETGGWIRWWVDARPPLPHIMIALTDDLHLSRELGQLAAGAPGAVLLEQVAADLVGLARYGAGRVDGTDLVAVTLPTAGGERSILVVPLPSAPSWPPGRAWLEVSGPALQAAQSIFIACRELEEAVASLSPADRAGLARGPRRDWLAMLRQAGQASGDAKKILDLISTAQKMLGGQ